MNNPFHQTAYQPLNPELGFLEVSYPAIKLPKHPERHLANPKRVDWWDKRRTVLQGIMITSAFFLTFGEAYLLLIWSHHFQFTLLVAGIFGFLTLLGVHFVDSYFSKITLDYFALVYLCRHPKTSLTMAKLHQKGYLFTNRFIKMSYWNIILKYYRKNKDFDITVIDLNLKLLKDQRPCTYKELMDFIFPPERVLALKEKETMQESLPFGILKEMKARL